MWLPVGLRTTAVWGCPHTLLTDVTACRTKDYDCVRVSSYPSDWCGCLSDWALRLCEGVLIPFWLMWLPVGLSTTTVSAVTPDTFLTDVTACRTEDYGCVRVSSYPSDWCGCLSDWALRLCEGVLIPFWLMWLPVGLSTTTVSAVTPAMSSWGWMDVLDTTLAERDTSGSERDTTSVLHDRHCNANRTCNIHLIS